MMKAGWWDVSATRLTGHAGGWSHERPAGALVQRRPDDLCLSPAGMQSCSERRSARCTRMVLTMSRGTLTQSPQ